MFKHFDRDHSGSIDRDELQKALAQFGYVLLLFHPTKMESHLSIRYQLSPYVIAEIQRKFGKLFTITRILIRLLFPVDKKHRSP
jgi:peflin